jgi:asparagine synthase (glutamine-hydrolysing)
MACVGAWLRALDQPSMDGLNVFVISKAVRAQGVIVALSGQGGDELFGGYPSFTDVPRARALLGRVAWVPRPVRAGLATMATMRRPQVFRQKAADMAGSDGSVLALYLHRRRALSDAQLRELGIEAAACGLDGYFLPPGAVDGADTQADAIATISRLESRLYMGNMLLRDGDANGMAHSLEIRVPFLDRRVIDLAYTVPGSVMLPEGKANKHLIRRAFGDLIRPELAGLKKRGFVLPTRRWMMGPLREMCEGALSHLKGTGLLRADGVDWVWRSFLASPESPIWSRALTLVVLGSYLSRRADPA